MKIERYITTGVKVSIPLALQMFLWELQSNIRATNKEIDYLQVYELKSSDDSNKKQLIIHRAEVPSHKARYQITGEEVIEQKIFIIEDQYQDKIVETMLLAEEY